MTAQNWDIKFLGAILSLDQEQKPTSSSPNDDKSPAP